MDFFQFLSSLVDSLAWPGLIIFFLIYFKIPIEQLFLRVTQVNASKKGLNIILQEVIENDPYLSKTELPPELERLTKSEPEEAIEQSVNELLTTASTASGRTVEPGRIVRISDMLAMSSDLANKDILDESSAGSVYRILEIGIRNKKTGWKNIEFIDPSSASSFASIAHGLSEKIKKGEKKD